MTNELPTSVIFGNCWELRVADLRKALCQHYAHQKMMVERGIDRRPDQSDFIRLTVRKDGKVVEGWRIEEVRSNLRPSVGVTRVSISFRGENYRALEYVAHTQQVQVLASPPARPVYP